MRPAGGHHRNPGRAFAGALGVEPPVSAGPRLDADRAGRSEAGAIGLSHTFLMLGMVSMLHKGILRVQMSLYMTQSPMKL